MNRQELINYVDQKHRKKEAQEFRVGDTVRVSVRITEGDATRIQVFEGIVISFKGHGGSRTFTVRKISFGVGVERCFPLISPSVDKIEVVRSGHSRRAKLYYLRDRVGRAAKLEDKDVQVLGDVKKNSSAAEPKDTGTPPLPQQELAAAVKK
ncbi:MAG: 50S ribosomal protein L19 [Elusimicrobia bacterium]|nr:50S ribosomal protein L19 [Elusimicrobiota bacterium]